MPEDRNAEWWQVGRYIPEDRQDIAFLISAALAAFFLLMTVISVTEGAGLSRELQDAVDDNSELRDRVAGYEAVYPERLQEAEAAFGAERERREEFEIKAGNLSGRMLEMKEELAAAKEELHGLRGDLAISAQAAERLKSELAEAEKREEELERLQRQHERLKGQLRTAEADLASFRDRSETVEGQKAGLESELDTYRGRIAELLKLVHEKEQDLWRMTDRLEEVEALLKHYPQAPLSRDAAERQFREIVDEVSMHTDHEERIAIFFRAKQQLAGTAYEERANAMWVAAQRALQDHVERLANDRFEQAREKIRAHPNSHDQNVVILQRMIEQVRGTKYEAQTQKLIEEQLEAKALGLQR